jgi:hypothetical protein
MKPEDVMPALRERGLVIKLAEQLGIRRQAVDAWRIVPAERVVVVSKLSGIPKHVIRPDIFPEGNSRILKPIEGRRTRVAQRRLEEKKGISRTPRARDLRDS